MTYDDPLFMAAKWGTLIGAEADDAPSDRDEREQWALERLRQGPPEAQLILEKMGADEDVRSAFFETFWDEAL